MEAGRAARNSHALKCSIDMVMPAMCGHCRAGTHNSQLIRRAPRGAPLVNLATMKT